MPTITRVQRLAELDAHNARTLKRIAGETSTSDTKITTARGATPAGDEERLRGIPVQGRGISGTLRGTQPHTALR